MPRSTRDTIKLRHDQTLKALEKAIAYVAELHDMFSGPHPEYAKGYENIIVILATAHEFVEKMKGFI